MNAPRSEVIQTRVYENHLDSSSGAQRAQARTHAFTSSRQTRGRPRGLRTARCREVRQLLLHTRSQQVRCDESHSTMYAPKHSGVKNAPHSKCSSISPVMPPHTSSSHAGLTHVELSHTELPHASVHVGFPHTGLSHSRLQRCVVSTILWLGTRFE